MIVSSSSTHAFRDHARVLAHQHHDDAGDHLASTVSRDGALPDPRREDGRSQVLDVDRSAARFGLDDDVVDVGGFFDEPLATNDVLLLRTFDVSAAGVGVVALERLEDIAERHVVRDELVRVELHFIRLQLAAEGVDFDDARHGPQLEGDVPLEDAAQVHRRHEPAPRTSNW